MRRVLPLLAISLVAACDGRQTMTGGDGAHGDVFNGLLGIFLAVTGFVYLVVLAFLAAAILRRRRERESGRGLTLALIGWTGFIALGLSVLTLASWFADRNMLDADAGHPLEIEIVAHQWWWDVNYRDPIPSRGFRTANELHLPVGVPARITLKSGDVIHSFWVPNLAGKQDLIPGRTNDIVLKPQREGLYRAQCAEFCGMQHAHMALDVTVESRDAFEAWRRRQSQPAPPPRTLLAAKGHDYFVGRECAMCHRIGGTPASGQVAPDLTHFASRRSIAAGTYPMTRGHLYAWVADPQSAKPGNHMPYIGLEPDELHAVVAYLETLK